MKTVVGLFDTSMEAEKAAQDLIRMGVARNDISLVANNEGGRYAPVTEVTTEGATMAGHAVGHDAVVGAEVGASVGFLVGLTGFAIPGLGWIAGAGWLMGTILGAGTGAVVGGLVGALTHVGVPHEDAIHYMEAVRRGGVLLALRAEDVTATRITEILGEDGAINIEERAEQYKQEGFLPTAITTTQVGSAQGETVLPVVEESIAIGKREVQSGGVRVYSHVTERLVQESVNLREEHITVERHPVNRPADANAFNNLREGVLEVKETAEVPVVAKEARVVEEVVVGKQATERTEMVHDMVRRTGVQVEQIAGSNAGVQGARDVAARLPGDPDNDYPDPPTAPPAQGDVPGVQTGGHAVDGSGMPDMRGITEKIADTVTGNRIDDKTGRPV